ncbi:eye-specific diacylglycerol kinase-like, partial [Sitophilus oryzae]|uniref:Eye-specific diacylglycerol kinase-like n=1 Tax=Sitophilus oryzae TaxID=7048 RepID=A0A6J2YTS1_SITOR
VPDLKRDRAASVDSCFSKVSEKKTEELQHSGVSLEVPVGPNVALRSRSVDIVLPTDEQARYKALAMAAPSSAQGQYRFCKYFFLFQPFQKWLMIISL